VVPSNEVPVNVRIAEPLVGPESGETELIEGVELNFLLSILETMALVVVLCFGVTYVFHGVNSCWMFVGCSFRIIYVEYCDLIQGLAKHSDVGWLLGA
jgi:hypothetical protein